MNKLLEKLKSTQVELNVCKIDCPELGEAQFIAEIDGREMDLFTTWWGKYRDSELDEDELSHDYRRACVAFCWCGEDRVRFNQEYRDFKQTIEALKAAKASLTLRLFNAANAFNCFAGVDDESKKSLLRQVTKAKNGDGNGEQPSH